MSFLHHRNPLHLQNDAANRAAPCIENLSNWDNAVKEITSWPEYKETPTWSLKTHAHRLGIGNLFYKDESTRFGRELGSFKALGAPYAVFSLLVEHVEARIGVKASASDLREGKFHHLTSSITVCVATDGNQGRGLAYGAKAFGCRCVVYMHDHVSVERKAHIERLGAVVIRVRGEYEVSVSRAKEDAAMNGWFFVSSTSWDDFGSVIPRNVMNGYMVMVEEVLESIPDVQSLTHFFMCAGVGSIAAAVFMGLASRCSSNYPRFVVIEPAAADCLYQSSVKGYPTPSHGDLQTVMAGLACREVSPAAYKILQWLASDFFVVPDEVAIQGMKVLAEGHGDIPIVCGESSGANMGVLEETVNDPCLRATLGLTGQSQVLIFGCEGATSSGVYEDLVGRHPDSIFEDQSQYLSQEPPNL